MTGIHGTAVEPSTPRLLRRGVLALAGLGVAGTAVDLAVARHWGSAVQLIPWACLLALAVAIALIAFQPGPEAIRVARVLVALVVVAAVFGIYEHVEANYHAAPLDAQFGMLWEGMSAGQRWWAAISQAVGPSPTAAPGVLVYIGLAVLLATVRHPALEAQRTGADQVEVAAGTDPTLLRR